MNVQQNCMCEYHLRNRNYKCALNWLKGYSHIIIKLCAFNIAVEKFLLFEIFSACDDNDMSHKIACVNTT
jgi:hypothetical protein